MQSMQLDLSVDHINPDDLRDLLNEEIDVLLCPQSPESITSIDADRYTSNKLFDHTS